jgi:hypothetical protein
MPSKTMIFDGVKITASRVGRGGPLAGLLALALALLLVVRVVVAYASPIAAVLTVVLATAAVSGAGVVAWRIAEWRRTGRDEVFVARKLAVELEAERAAQPAAPVRVEATRELEATPPVVLSEAERTARGLAALEAAARRFDGRAPVDLDELIRRSR